MKDNTIITKEAVAVKLETRLLQRLQQETTTTTTPTKTVEGVRVVRLA
jgi:hypothetical protein